MNVVARTRKPRQLKPVTIAWTWHRRMIWPCEIIPAGIPGLLEIGGVVYEVSALIPGGFQLVNRLNGKVYHIDTADEPWTCDCGDYTFRRANVDPKGCKHIQNLTAALKSLWEDK